MTGKRVRFSGKTLLYSPNMPPRHKTIPPLPSLAREDHSSESTDSILTPPVYPTSIPASIAGRYSHPGIASSKSYPAPTVLLHYVLQHSSTIYFDVRQHPSTIRARRDGLSSSVLSEPATSPPSQYMRLTSRYIPWSIVAKPRGYSHSSHIYYVTVADVLDAIYFTLRTNITPAEFASLGEGSRAQTKARRAYEDRYRRIKDAIAYKEEKKGGMKRVDFLLDHNKFFGLTPHHVERGEWELHTAGK